MCKVFGLTKYLFVMFFSKICIEICFMGSESKVFRQLLTCFALKSPGPVAAQAPAVRQGHGKRCGAVFLAQLSKGF